MSNIDVVTESGISRHPTHEGSWNLDRAKERCAELGRHTKDNAIRGLENASTRLHDKAEHITGERARRVAHATADKLHNAAGYMRRHDTKAMASDLESVVKRHPGQALMGAVVLGFCVGRVFRRNGDF